MPVNADIADSGRWVQLPVEGVSPTVKRVLRRNILHAGVSTGDVTPPVGYRLQGHAARKAPSNRVHDPLKLKVLTLFDGKTRVAIVTSDLIEFSNESVVRIRREAKRRLGLAPECVFITSSHTHTGPCMHRKSSSMSPEHILPAYIRTVEDKAVGGMVEAMGKEEPVAAQYGRRCVEIGAISRRLWTGKELLFRPNPNGPRDDVLNVLRFDRRNGTPLAVLFRYSCHPTVIGIEFSEISADYPGAAQRLIETAFPGATALFIQGCCGDVRPGIIKNGRFAGGTFGDVECMGHRLADAVLQAAETARQIDQPVLSVALRRLPLPLAQDKQPRDMRHLTHLVRDYKNENPEFSAWIDTWGAYWRVRLRAGKRLTRSVPMTMHAFRLGDVMMLGLAAEVMAEYGDWIRNAVGSETIVAGYTNGDIGYLPTAEALAQGGYEAVYHLFENISAPFSPKIKDRVLRMARQVAKRVQQP